MKSALPLILAVVLAGYDSALADHDNQLAEYMNLEHMQGGGTEILTKGPDHAPAIKVAAAKARREDLSAAAVTNKNIQKQAKAGVTHIKPETIEGPVASTSSSAEIVATEPVSVPVEGGTLEVVAEGVIVGDGQVTVAETVVDPVTGQSVTFSDTEKDSAIPYRKGEIRASELKVS